MAEHDRADMFSSKQMSLECPSLYWMFPKQVAWGVAMLAKAYATGENVAAIAAGWVKAVSKAEPDTELIEHYNKMFSTYKMLYPTLKSLY